MSRWPAAAPVISPQSTGGSITGEGRPCSNTGRTDRREVRQTLPKLSHDGQALSGALVDWLSFTVRPQDEEQAELLRQQPTEFARELIRAVFGDPLIECGEVEHRGLNGYTHRAEISARGKHAAGSYVALGGNEGTVNVQLSGTGCAQVQCWYTVALALSRLGARITRIDLAYDDYLGRIIDLDRWMSMAQSKEIRASAGQSPKHRLIKGDDGTTLYVGRKGSKELCVYQKGKEQGDPDSPWLRAEVRFWAKDREIPYAALTQCLSFIRAAYNVLSELPGDVCERMKTIARSVAAKAVAALSWARHAFGPLLNTFVNALGEDRTSELIMQDIRRSAIPRRFASFSRDQLDKHLQESLCPF